MLKIDGIFVLTTLDGDDVCKGTLDELNKFATDKGWRFVKTKNLFGGYYVDDSNPNKPCYEAQIISFPKSY